MTKTAIQLQNTMTKSLVGIKANLTKAFVGNTMPPSFLMNQREVDEKLDLGKFMREARKAVQAMRRRAQGMVF